MTRTYHDVELPDAPILAWLDSQAGGSVAKGLARLAASGRLADLESEIHALRAAVAKSVGGNTRLRVKLAEVEQKADHIPELRVEYERRASALRKQISEG